MMYVYACLALQTITSAGCLHGWSLYQHARHPAVDVWAPEQHMHSTFAVQGLIPLLHPCRWSSATRTAW
jgi:hypothetical protein